MLENAPFFAHLWHVASLAGHWCFGCDGILPHRVQLFVFPGLLMGISPDFVTFGLFDCLFERTSWILLPPKTVWHYPGLSQLLVVF